MIAIKENKGMTSSRITSDYEEYVSKRRIVKKMDLVTDEELIFELKLRGLL